MRVSYGFLGVVGLIAASLLFVFGLLAFEPKADVATGAASGQDVAPLTAPTVSFGNPAKGGRNVPVTVIEFGDFQCEPCRTLAGVLDQAVAARPDDVRVVWKDFPNKGSHPLSLKAAQAARCADEQGAFWDYHRLLFSDQSAISDAAFPVYATALGLDEKKFTSCMTESRGAPLIERDMSEAIRLGLDATPYLFINGRRVSGAIGADALNAIVDEAKAAKK